MKHLLLFAALIASVLTYYSLNHVDEDEQVVFVSTSSDRHGDIGAWVAGVMDREPPNHVTTTTAAMRRPIQSTPPWDDWTWDELAQCESGGDWANDSFHDGGLQFHPDTWTNYGGGTFAPYAWGATREQQIVVAERVLAAEGPGAWPVCSYRIGMR